MKCHINIINLESRSWTSCAYTKCKNYFKKIVFLFRNISANRNYPHLLVQGFEHHVVGVNGLDKLNRKKNLNQSSVKAHA